MSNYSFFFENHLFFEKDIDDEITEQQKCFNFKIIDNESRFGYWSLSKVFGTQKNVQQIESTPRLSYLISEHYSVMRC
ncbi:MAG: hypothetical protein GXO93_08295 [FCB group bacterium]|nr:hypothetical protein [FCB group bacterium]